MERSIVRSLVILFFFALLPLKAFSLPGYVVVGYAPGYNSNAAYNFTGNFAGDVPWSNLSHVNYAFVTISGTTAVVSDGAGVAAAICNQAHSHGVRCYLSVGGANPSTQWNSITSTGNAQTLANSITSLIHYGGVTFDGIDVDWEFPSDSTVYNALLTKIHSNLSSIQPGLLPSGNYPESTEGLTVYLSPGNSVCGYAFTTSNSLVDWYTDSGYDLNVGVSGDQWNGALIDPVNKQFTNCLTNSMQLSINTIANWYNTVGNGGTIPYSKMVLGMPLYGRNSGGGSTTPDAVAFGGSGSGYNSTAAEEMYGSYSMDTAQSFCDKMNWAIGTKGMKGIAMWDLGQGLPTTANSMMTSVWNVINGSASCLTVGGGPGSPTATPTSTPSCGTIVADFESGSAQDNLGGFTSLSAGSCTMNPTSWAPSAGYGLNGTTYGARVYGTTAGCAWGPSVLVPLGAGTPSYNANSHGQNAETFRLKITTGPASGPATLIVGVVPTNGTSSGFQYNLVIQPIQFGTDLTETVFFSQMDYAYGTTLTLDTTQLYQLYFTPYPGWGNYDITIDQIVFTCAPTPTPTPTNTNTATFTKTYTPTNTVTNTPTNTFTVAPPTNTFTFTPTNTNTYTYTFTKTDTPTNSFTNTPTITNTPTTPFTNTPTNSFTDTSTNTWTSTKTDTPTNTNSPTITDTPTDTPTNTWTGTPTNTYTGTVPPTDTPTNSFTPTNTSTSTSTSTNSFTDTFTPANTSTNTWTETPTNSFTFTFTGTPTFTFTNTDSPTYTDTPTDSFTPTNSFTGTLSPSDTPTNTPTNTWTGTSTNSSTPTDTSASTNTSTPTNSFTASFTPTATFTATQPVVQLGNGPNPPSNSTVPAGSTNQVVMQVSVDNTSGESLQLNDLLLTFTGTGDAASGIVSVTLWKDPSGNGITSGSSVLATVNSPFASGTTASVVFNDTVGAGATQNYLITYNFASGAAAGTYSVSLANGAALTGQGTVSLQSLQVQGAPVSGALLMVIALTATPSLTPTVTSSFTPVPPTVTPTETPIVRVTLGDPYPNPVSGAGELSINVTAPGESSLSFAVFTTSYRKIWDDTIPAPQGPSIVHWNLRNKEGVPVADGLYYIRLQVIGLHTTTKVFKVLVLQ